MARPIPSLSTYPWPIHVIPSVYIVFAVMLIMCIFSLVTFLCASHRKHQKEEASTREKLASKKKYLRDSLSKANSISSKALLKMVSWRKQVQHGDDDDEGNLDYYDVKGRDDYVVVDDEGFQVEDAVWKKTIIKGGKCRPLNFSGKIEYDSEGNLVPDSDKSLGDKENTIYSNNKDEFVS